MDRISNAAANEGPINLPMSTDDFDVRVTLTYTGEAGGRLSSIASGCRLKVSRQKNQPRWITAR